MNGLVSDPVLHTTHISHCVCEGEQQLLLCVMLLTLLVRACSPNECEHVAPVFSEEQSLSAGLIISLCVYMYMCVCVCVRIAFSELSLKCHKSFQRPPCEIQSDITIIEHITSIMAHYDAV